MTAASFHDANEFHAQESFKGTRDDAVRGIFRGTKLLDASHFMKFLGEGGDGEVKPLAGEVQTVRRDAQEKFQKRTTFQILHEIVPGEVFQGASEIGW